MTMNGKSIGEEMDSSYIYEQTTPFTPLPTTQVPLVPRLSDCNDAWLPKTIVVVTGTLLLLNIIFSK